MADISSLSGLQAGEPLDWDGYADAKESAPPPPKGRYQFQTQSPVAFSASKQNFLQAQIDPTIVGPASAGYKVNYTRVSVKPFKRGQATVSQAGDYLRAVFGQSAPRPTTPQEQADALERTAGALWQGDGDWEAYCKQCQKSVKGMERFPRLENGAHSHYIECPSGCKDDTGTAVNLRANFKVDRYVPQGA